MRIEAYFQHIRAIIESAPIVVSSDIAYDKRSAYEGFIRGEVFMLDGSILHIREYVDVESQTERLTYAYQYMDSNKNLIFRYDNTGHSKHKNLASFPHHKHEKNDVIASTAPDLEFVLEDISQLMSISD
ncbi:MAG: hypothetical protein HZC40_08525 [Chloroflexi bacterium]|nr:hypothetical protein [Chloroflexota bacterium]